MSTVADKIEAAQQRVAAVGYDYATRETVAVSACPLCESPRFTQIHDHDRFGFPVESVLCDDCGFVFLNPRLTPSGYAEFYTHYYRPLVSALTGEENNAHSILESQRLHAEALCDFLGAMGAMAFRRTLLDIGGSTGALCDAFKKRWGYECTVVDPSPDELAIAESKLHKTHLGLVDHFEPEQRYDVVAMVQTVDHLLEPLTTLRRVRQWVEPHGLLLIDFVDFGLVCRTFGIGRAIKLDHPSNFTTSTAYALMLRAGFEPVLSGCTRDNRHLIFACRPVPELHRAMPNRLSVDKARRELLEGQP